MGSNFEEFRLYVSWNTTRSILYLIHFHYSDSAFQIPGEFDNQSVENCIDWIIQAVEDKRLPAML